MLQQLLRAQFALFCMLAFGWAASAQCDAPLAFDTDLSDYAVECPSDLPTGCDESVGANRGDVSCVMGEQRLLQTECAGTTAEGTGADGAIVLFDIDGDPNDDRYFIPTDEGISLIQYENGVAHITGQVQDASNASAILNLNIVYDGGVSGADWDGGFKHDQTCPVTADVTDTWMVYVMNAGLSYLIGEGDLDGTLLTLTHAPASEYFGFQIGEMANDRNCNYGAGGWFSYSGTLNGTEIQGAQGDVLLDLSCGEEAVANCGEDGPSVTLIYTVIDTDCGDALTTEQIITRDDTTDPTWDNAPDDVTMACADAPLPVAVLTASDNCEADDGEPTVTYTGESAQYDVLCTGSYKVDRTWEAVDCSGNAIGHTQTITVVDDVAPVITGGSNYLAECDGAGNADELANFLNTHGEATAADVCGTVTWSHDYTDGDLSDDCGATGTVDVLFTATDDCGNAASITLTFTIQDTGLPTLTVAPVHEVDCELYDPSAVYASSSTDLCGDATVVLVSVNEVSSSCAGQFLHTYKAVDDCGNESATMDQVVTLLDAVNPVPSIACPADTELFTDENCSADTSVETNGTATGSATDNCDDAPSVAISHEDVVTPGCTGSYSIARTWTATATDHCGNTASTTCVQTIVVTDNIPPVPSIACPADFTVHADENCAADTTPAAAGSATATATDNCNGEIDIQISSEDGAPTSLCDGQYSFVRTWTALATDDCGNSASTSCPQTITVEDHIAPTWNAYDTYVNAACEDLLDPTDPTLVPISASDNCSDVTYSIQAFQLSGGCPGTWMRVWTATDDCGNNSETTEQYVQLYDIIAPTPVITCPADYTVDADENCEADTTPAAAGSATATATDNCDSDVDITITFSDGESTSLCVGQYSFTRTWTASAIDDCDNPASVSCDQLITVEDNTAPVIDPASEDHTVECDGAGNVQDLADWLADNGGAEATDNCSAVTWSHDYLDGNMSDLCAATGSVDVIFTASDDCGNSSQTTSTFTIEDTTAPAFSGDAEVSISCEEYACDADALEALGIFSIDEACGDYTLSASCTSFSGGCVTPVGAHFVEYTAVDECGNTSAFSQVVILSDEIKPVPAIECPAAIALTADADCSADLSTDNTGMATASATDNCDAAPLVEVTFTDGAQTAICAGSYSFTRTFTATATDHCGNTDSISCDQLITVNDETAPAAPVIEAPADTEVLLDADCAADTGTDETGVATATATDNCDSAPSVAITSEDSAPAYSCAGDDAAEGSYTFTRTWTAIATDDCGNVGAASTHVQTITVTDNLAPDFAGSANEFEIACDAYSDTEMYSVMAADNCDSDVSIEILSNTQVSGSCAGTVLRTYKATDDCGNSTEFQQVIDLLDEVAPELTLECPANANLTADATCSADTSLDALGTATYTATDNCDDALAVSLTHADVLTPGCTGSYTIERTFTLIAEDHCENTSTLSCTQTITVSDETAPSMDIAAANLTVECDGAGNVLDYLTWQSANGNAQASDNCSAVTWSSETLETGDDCGGTVGYSTVAFTATDDCGNATSTTATFTIEDTTAPSITADLETSVPCDAYNAETPYGNYSASDICSGNVTTAIADLEVSGPCAGTIMRTYTATDDCGNATTFDQIINLTDDEAPTLTMTCPADAILSAGADCSADTSVDANGSATYADLLDNCDTEVEVLISSSDAVAYPCEGSMVITRTWTITAEDHCANMTTLTCDQTITVNDDTAPSITCPADLTVECDGNGNAADLAGFLAGVSATDNCSAVSITNNFDALSDDCGATGTATVTFTATDACGNQSSCDATFTIEDTAAPSMDIAAANLTVECDGAGNVLDYLTWQSANGNAQASDNCSAVTWSSETLETGDDCGGTVGYSTVAFTATDDCGNATSTTATFTIEDTTAPSITADLETSVPCDEYNAETPYGNYSASDICSGNVTTAIADLEVSGPCAGTIMRTYTATDDCGNATTFDQIINLTDDEAPTLTMTCPADAVLSAGADCSADTSVDANGSATYADLLDNCDTEVEVLISSSDAVAYPCEGSMVITRTWTITAEDHCANMTTLTCDQTITVNDDTAPSITCPADLTVECDGNGNAADLAGFLAGVSATDNCSAVSITNNFDALSDDCGATGTATVTFTATDACGNQSSCDATFTIEDTAAPSLTIEGPANQDLLQTASCDLDTSVDALGTVSYEAGDACGSAAVVITHEDGLTTMICAGDDDSTEGSYTFDRTFTATATDECGLETVQTYVQTITVTDAIAPQFSNTCDLENGAAVEVCCESHLGEVAIPEACEPAYTDNCDSDVAYSYTETLVGAYAPTDDVDLFCLSTTPAAFAGDETCNGYDPHSLRIFALPGGAEFYTAAGPGLVAHNADGSWTLTQSVVAADGANAGWDITATYGEAHDWTSWNSQAFPTGFKRDCGDLIDDHLNWEFRIMESGSLTGTGDYAGSSLSLTHAPSNNYYAFQLGLGANNMNNEYGYSGWFTYSGSFMGNDIMGSGDMFGDLDCCLPWSIDRDYAIADDCGNGNAFAYTVQVNGADCAGGSDAQVSGAQDGNHTPVVIGGAGNVATGKTPIRVTNLQPNPTNDMSQLGFVVTENMRIRVDLVGMDGVMVSELFDGIAQTGVNHTLDIEAGSLSNGMYQIRLSSQAYLVVKKLLVSE